MRPAGAAGFSIIELMIAMTLGLLAIAAVGNVFISGSRSYKEDDRRARMQDELRFAMAQLTLDLEMAGFFAQIRDVERDIEVDADAAIARDCGPPPAAGTWVYHERGASLFTVGNATAAAAHAAFPCIAAEEFMPNTDVIAIKRLGGSLVTSLEGPRIYLKTNGVRSVLFQGKDDGSVPPARGAAVTTWEYQPSVWFIRKHAFATQDPPVPSLCRRRLAGGEPPAMDVECLAQGIQDLQVEFGFDADANGVPDSFREYGAFPGTTEMARVVAVRVHLLARAAEADPHYRGVKTFQLGGTTVTADDRYYRTSLSSVVLLRNLAHRLTPQELPQ